MLYKKLFVSCLLLLTVLVQATNANAISINGQTFNKILEVSTANQFGYWPGYGKFYSFIGNGDGEVKPAIPDNINGVSFRSSDLSGVNFAQVFMMGTTTGPATVNGSNFTASIATGNVILYGPGNQILLSATYADTGRLSGVTLPGYAGQLNQSGVYDVTGGSLFSSGLVTGSIYVDVSFDYLWQSILRKDLNAAIGTYTFYQAASTTPPVNPVPEPASVALLAGSLIGLARKRKSS